MIRKTTWHYGLVVVSLLLVGLLAWLSYDIAQAAKGGNSGGGGGGISNTGRFTCRASALRAEQLPILGFLELSVANPPEDPCVTDNKTVLGVTIDGISAEVLVADTEDSQAPISSEAFAAGVGINLGGLLSLTVGVLDATADVNSVNGQCALSGQSFIVVTSATILGIPLNLLVNTHLEIPVPLVATIHLNETLGGPSPTSGAPDPNRVTQRALWIQAGTLLQALGIQDVIVGEATADFEDGNPCAKPPKRPADKRRMTGGGKFTDGVTTVTHGFVLHCNKSRLPNNLQVNWNGNSFHLESLTFADCDDDPTLDPAPPPASFDTYIGEGTGRLNGVSGATAMWVFTDDGEPGTDGDTASILIKDNNGNTVLNVEENTLFMGNHQAHK